MSGVLENRYLKKGEYIAISAIFFSFVVLVITRPIQSEIPYFGTNMFAAIFFFLGIVSFSGSILFLHFMKREVQIWYLGIPLVIAIAIVTITSFFYPSLPSGFPMYGAALFNSKIQQIATYLLAPFSALFFYSLMKMRDEMKILVPVSLGISIVFSGLIIDIPMMNDLTPYLAYYWLIGMPLIGIEFLATFINVN